MADVLAEAVVELEADIDKFNKDFNRSLKQAEKDAKATTTNIDKAFEQMSGNLGKEFEKATKDIEKEFKRQEKLARDTALKIEHEAGESAKRAEKVRIQALRAVERETLRAAREQVRAQKEYEREFIASQRAMEKAHEETQRRQAEQFQSFIAKVRKLASERFSLTLGVDTSQLGVALAAATKLGSALGLLGAGTIVGGAAIPTVAKLAVVLQDLISSIALLPAVGAAAGIVIGTLTLGLRGLGDAISADSPKELDEAFKSLSENGKKFALTVRDLKDEFTEFTKSIQQSLFAGLDREVAELAKVLLPLLQRNFGKIATELNSAAITLSAFVREAKTLKDVERIFTNTQQSLFVFRRSLAPLAQAFRDIAAVGSDFLPVIAADLGGVASRFGDFIANARETNSLKFMFENAVQALRDFFGILGNIGGIFGSILDNARLAFGNRGLLGFIRDVTESFDDFLNSIEGQVALLKFFESTAKAAEVVVPILQNIGQLIFQTVLPAFVQLGTVAAPGINALIDGLSRGLEKAIPGIVSFVDSLSSIVISLVDAGVLDALGDLVRVLGTTLGAALRHLAPTLGDLINSILLKLTEILPKILPALGKFADALGELVIAALPVVDVLADIISNVGLPTLQRIAEKLTPLIADLAESLSDVLLPVLPDLADAFSDWVDEMAPIVDDVLVIFVDLLKILVPLLPPIVRSSVELAKALAPLVQLFADIIEPISKFITKLYEIPGVKKFMEEQLPGILALITGSIIVPLGKFLEILDKIITKLDEAGVFDIFINALNTLGDVLAVNGDAFKTFGFLVESTIETIKEVARFGIDFIADIVTSGFGIIQGVFTSAWESIKAIFSSAWEVIKIIAGSAVQIVIAVITGGFSSLPSIVTGALGRLRDAAGEGFNRLLDFVVQLPGRIVRALGDLSMLLYGVGQSLVQGFIDGIGSMIGAIAGQATTMGRVAVSAAERAINAHSPSREMMNVGEDFGAGFVIGIEHMLRRASQAGAELAAQTVRASATALAPSDNSVYRMNETLNRLTRNGLGPAPTSTTSASTTDTRTSPVVVTPEVHVYIGDEEINSHITDVVDERDRRTKRSLTMGAGRIV